MASVTHKVYMTDLKCALDLKYIALKTRDVVVSTRAFHVLRWRHKKIGGTCMIYSSGKVIHHGEKNQLRKYARLLQKMGYAVRLTHIKLLTRSATYTLPPVNYKKLVQTMNASYEPEIYHACILKKDGMCFTIYKSGKVVITGIKNMDDALGVLIEIAWQQ